MHEFIMEPVHGRIALSVSPKVACVTLRMWLWELGCGSRFAGGCIFNAFAPYTIRMGAALPDTVELTAAIHRDGISRLQAVYDHRIRREREAPDQGLEHFARHLPEYCTMYPKVGHHCRAQSSWLVSDRSAFPLWFSHWYAHDTAVGWDGTTLQIFGQVSERSEQENL